MAGVHTLTHICPTSFGFPCRFANAARLIGSNSLICRALPPHLHPAGKHSCGSLEIIIVAAAELDSYSRPPGPSLRLLLRLLSQWEGKAPIHKQMRPALEEGHPMAPSPTAFVAGVLCLLRVIPDGGQGEEGTGSSKTPPQMHSQPVSRQQ